MLRACLQVAVPSFLLVPHSQDSFSFQVFVSLSGNHPQCMATVFVLLVQTQTFKLQKSLHTVLEELKKKKKLSAEEQVQAGGYASTVHF